ncbi:hypothetical protein [Vagococcus fessus]|nr:hypothetical protein [Vagococcus fessus]
MDLSEKLVALRKKKASLKKPSLKNSMSLVNLFQNGNAAKQNLTAPISFT